MSDNYLRLIPAVPTFVPSEDAQKEAKRLFAMYLPQGESICVSITQTSNLLIAVAISTKYLAHIATAF